jgi:hypothetical protein
MRSAWYLNALPVDDATRRATACFLVQHLREIDDIGLFTAVPDADLIAALMAVTGKPQFKLSPQNNPILTGIFCNVTPKPTFTIVKDDPTTKVNIFTHLIKKKKRLKVRIFSLRRSTTR